MDNKTNTLTQIRTIYSEGYSYVTIKFYNMSLLMQFVPFVSKDPSGKNIYDVMRSQSTTINWDGAYTLYKFGKDIIEGNILEGNVQLACNNSSLVLERKVGMNGYETLFTINKNGTSISFKFTTQVINIKENGQYITKTIESGLGAFIKTLEGYLTGINSARHLNKFTDDYIKMQSGSTNDQTKRQDLNKPQYNNYQKNKYQKNNQWNKNNYNYNHPSWETQNPNQQNISSYKIQ